MIKEVKTVVFSPTGSTAALVKKVGEKIAKVLGVPVSSDNFTLPEGQKAVRSYDADTLVVFGTPTYAGRVPNKALPFVQTLFTGHDTPAVALVTFGNRSYDSALTELAQELTAHGFHAVSAGAFARKHAFANIGTEHPTEADDALLEQLVAETAALLQKGKVPDVVIRDGAPVAPYYIPKGEDGQPAKFLKAKPKTDLTKCDHCGKCAEVCPMGSINKENTDEVPGICIKCQACIVYCPKQAKYFDDPRFLSHKAMLEKNFQRTAASEIFVGK
ncbi:MAG: 4Fe-4S binding protein [Acidaminococcus sp.]|jgi:ferredoxin/flavodoxin|nr:4Fe-4S binding protein [Acidaminococcus sp.]MCI2100260.1 4Fe-4S binding protein [Acidaminococcus sp.]MCI2114580.1 4Fe-4S binding protein [Acidaminococcus sp.]MCI2116557.1 4Fe-4S binding protein [Acidaminococcus sp.]